MKKIVLYICSILLFSNFAYAERTTEQKNVEAQFKQRYAQAKTEAERRTIRREWNAKRQQAQNQYVQNLKARIARANQNK